MKDYKGFQLEDKVRSLDRGSERHGRDGFRFGFRKRRSSWSYCSCVCEGENPSVQGLLTLVMDILQTLGNSSQNVQKKSLNTDAWAWVTLPV